MKRSKAVDCSGDGGLIRQPMLYDGATKSELQPGTLFKLHNYFSYYIYIGPYGLKSKINIYCAPDNDRFFGPPLYEKDVEIINDKSVIVKLRLNNKISAKMYMLAMEHLNDN